MRCGQSLCALAARCLEGLDAVLAQHEPDCVVAQGDTISAMAAALAAFYRGLPLVHVEAGLRSGDPRLPWPEEFNRRVATLAATLHCAPTPRAAQDLLAEGVPGQNIRVTGNTVIDALLETQLRERSRGVIWSQKHAALGDRRLVLITCHRRENLPAGLESICRAVAQLSRCCPEVEFVFPLHLNPAVQLPARRVLNGLPNVHLLPPATYPEFVWLLSRSSVILTDSGGVQEEAPSLGKPVVLLRETTERPEAVECGATWLAGTDPDAIFAAVLRLLSDPAEYARRQVAVNPYGDGAASPRIVDWMLQRLSRLEPACPAWHNAAVLRAG
jgi:UDP-N-acetylglucosamine 2-epimerase (non-hydrolysing)